MTTYEVINFHVPLNVKTHLHKYLVNIEEYCLLDWEKFAFLEKLRSKEPKQDRLHRKWFHAPFLFIMEPEELMFRQWWSKWSLKPNWPTDIIFLWRKLWSNSIGSL